MPAATEPTTKLGAAIRKRRLSRGYKRQSDLASALGVTQATVSAWETGDRIPERDMMALLHTLIGVPYVTYFADVGVMDTQRDARAVMEGLRAHLDEMPYDQLEHAA